MQVLREIATVIVHMFVRIAVLLVCTFAAALLSNVVSMGSAFGIGVVSYFIIVSNLGKCRKSQLRNLVVLIGCAVVTALLAVLAVDPAAEVLSRDVHVGKELSFVLPLLTAMMLCSVGYWGIVWVMDEPEENHKRPDSR
jgi:hypothetical protein